MMTIREHQLQTALEACLLGLRVIRKMETTGRTKMGTIRRVDHRTLQVFVVSEDGLSWTQMIPAFPSQLAVVVALPRSLWRWLKMKVRRWYYGG